jgi:hypothetical protein
VGSIPVVSCKITHEEGGGALWAARERRGEELGALGPDMREGGRFSARNRESSPEGSIPVVSVKEHMRRVVGPCGLRERGGRRAGGPGARYA